MDIKPIENNSVYFKLKEIKNNRFKGHLRQVEILKFLTIWKFATKKQLAYLTGETPENITKHLNRLEKLGYIKKHKHQGYTIIERTDKTLHVIEELTGIEYEFFKTKERWNKEYIEHDLMLRNLAIQTMNYLQYPIKTSLYFRKIYQELKKRFNEKYAKKIVRSLHIVDFVILFDFSYSDKGDEVMVIGIEYENTRKGLKELRRKIKSMKESIDYYSNYFFFAKNENILKNLPSKMIRASKGIDDNLEVMKISNLLEDGKGNYNFSQLKFSNRLDFIAKISAIDLLEDIEKLHRIVEIPELVKKSM